MIALDGDGWNSRGLQALKRFLRLDQRLRVNRPLVEQVARDDEEIHAPRNCVLHDRQQGTGEIVKSFLEAVLLVPQVIVGGMDETRAHGMLQYSERTGRTAKYHGLL